MHTWKDTGDTGNTGCLWAEDLGGWKIEIRGRGSFNYMSSLTF